MISVLFFASIREQLQTDRLSITADASVNILTVEQLVVYLASTHDQSWLQILSADNVIKAVNQQVVDNTYALSDGDEVAFFPPVTGG
jgi:molybdopterin synthase sulfur carrier subunit